MILFSCLRKYILLLSIWCQHLIYPYPKRLLQCLNGESVWPEELFDVDLLRVEVRVSEDDVLGRGRHQLRLLQAAVIRVLRGPAAAAAADGGVEQVALVAAVRPERP